MIQIDQNEIEESCEKCGGIAKAIIAIEECSELQKALTKTLRVILNSNYTFENVRVDDVIEETADVLICIENLKKIFGITDDDINRIIKQKQERQRQIDKNA